MTLPEKKNYVRLMYEDLDESIDKFLKGRNDKWLRYSDANYQNHNHGVTVIKRKIIALRQELLNLSEMINDVKS